MRRLLSCLAAAALAAPVGAAPAALGDPSLDALASKGVAVLQGAKAKPRLRYVHSRGLEELARRAEADSARASARRAAAEGRTPAAAAFQSLLALPVDGPMTPALSSLATALSAWSELAKELGEAAVPNLPLLFETDWGRAFSARTHAELEDDPIALAKPFFDGTLAGPWRDAEAQTHFLEFVRARHQVDLSKTLARDAGQGRASEELRSWLIRYLGEQRRLSAVKRLQAAVAALEKKSPVLAELAELESASRAAADKPAPRPAEDPAAPRPSLRSTGLHVRQPTRLKRYELGDEAFVSGGYWVDGLAENETAELIETSFIEGPFSALELRSQAVKRSNGGPYPFERRLTLGSSRGFTLVSIISADGSNSLVEKASVEVARDYETALESLAEAERQALSCEFKSAGHEAVAASHAAAAKEKPQYARLVKAARDSKARADKDAVLLAKLEELIAESRADASPETCRYEPKRTESALATARALPAACGRFLPELNFQLSVIRRRAADQELFKSWSAKSRALAKSCKLSLAVDEGAGALALLEADPAARCGEHAGAAERLAKELADWAAAEAWRTEFAAQIKAAAAESSADARLTRVNPVLARINGSPFSACFKDELKDAQAVSEAASKAYEGPDFKTALTILPADYQLNKTDAEIVEERRKLEESAKQLETKKAAEQAPGAAIPEAIAPAGAGAPKKSESERAPAPAKSTEKPKIKAKPAKPRGGRTAPKKTPATKPAPAPKKTSPAPGEPR